MAEPLTPNCPLCSGPPAMVIGGALGTQAFCGNDGCTLLLWDRSLSLDDNLLNAGVVKLPQAEGGDGA
jgi:hypothetical protein